MRNDGTAGGATTARSGGAALAVRTTLEVPAIRLDVRLGCEAPERAVPQAVDLALVIDFATAPAACTSDELADTVCYAELAGLAGAYCAAREFRLVERLARAPEPHAQRPGPCEQSRRQHDADAERQP